MNFNFKLVCAVAGLFYASAVLAGDVVDRKYRERYLPQQSKKGYYKTQVMLTNFFDRQTSEINGLVESFRGTSIYSYDIFTQAFIYGRGGALDAQSFTYDSAVASLAYMAAGQFKKAANILGAYKQEFYCIKNDRFGLFNSYKTDKPMTKWGLSIGIDGDRMHAGPTIWIAIAAVQYTALSGKVDYLPFAIDISKWCDSLPHYVLAGGQRGAVSMGYGWGPDWSKVYSTENIVDNYALLKMLKELYESKNESVRKIFDERKYYLTDIKRELFAIERWMMEVAYDKTKKTFNMGANENGVDSTDALDAVSWTIAALTPERLIEMGADPFHLMAFADKNYLVDEKIDGVKIEGYDFTNLKGRRKDYRLLWFEGTGFHIVTMQVMSQFAKSQGFEKRADYFQQKASYYLNEMNKASQLCKMDSALPYTAKKPKEKEIYTTFRWEWEIPRGKGGNWVSSASSTAWYLMAISAFNPLGFDKENVNYKIFK
jgi:hypothetical protein